MVVVVLTKEHRERVRATIASGRRSRMICTNSRAGDVVLNLTVQTAEKMKPFGCYNLHRALRLADAPRHKRVHVHVWVRRALVTRVQMTTWITLPAAAQRASVPRRR